jgi:hypothetical protein
VLQPGTEGYSPVSETEHSLSIRKVQTKPQSMLSFNGPFGCVYSKDDGSLQHRVRHAPLTTPPERQDLHFLAPPLRHFGSVSAARRERRPSSSARRRIPISLRPLDLETHLLPQIYSIPTKWCKDLYVSRFAAPLRRRRLERGLLARSAQKKKNISRIHYAQQA